MENYQWRKARIRTIGGLLKLPVSQAIDTAANVPELRFIPFKSSSCSNCECCSKAMLLNTGYIQPDGGGVSGFAGSRNSSRSEAMMFIAVCARFVSDVGESSFNSRLMNLMQGGSIHKKTKSSVCFTKMAPRIEHGSVFSQDVRRGCQPSWCGSRYTSPHRGVVAGEATAKSPTSKIIDIVPDIWIISLFGKQSFLLSSSIVFMFSI